MKQEDRVKAVRELIKTDDFTSERFNEIVKDHIDFNPETKIISFPVMIHEASFIEYDVKEKKFVGFCYPQMIDVKL